MSEDRLAAAVAELVDALREEIANAAPAAADGPLELMSPATFAQRAGLARSTTYLAIADGTIRSVKIRGRRLVASSELARIAAAATPPPDNNRPARSMRITRAGRRAEGNADARPIAAAP